MKYFFFLFFASSVLCIPAAAQATHLNGHILLQVEEHGEAWYVYPEDDKRYYMKDGEVAYEMLRQFGLGITNSNLNKIPVGLEDRFEDTDRDGDGLADQLEEGLGTDADEPDTDGDGIPDGDEVRADTDPLSTDDLEFDNDLTEQLKGRILLQVQSHGEAWYIHPDSGRRYYMKDGDAAYQIMRFLSLGITNKDLVKIWRGSLEPADPRVDQYMYYWRQDVATPEGPFNVRVSTIDLTAPGLEILTDTVASADCERNCPVKSLGEIAMEHQADFAFNGSYFCPDSYASCAGEENYFFYPFYDTALGRLINEDELAFASAGSVLAFGSDNMPHFYQSVLNFKSIADFEATNNTQLQALIGNSPTLLYEYTNMVERHSLDNKQLSQKLDRAAIGYTDTTLYILHASGATVYDMAEIAKSLGLRYALNLDGGLSSAIYYDGRYLLGPGRDIPNAILFRFAE